MPTDDFILDQMLDTPTVQALAALGACERALDWARAQGCYVSGQELWEACTDGHWMLWFLVRVIPGHPNYHRFIARMTARALVVKGLIPKEIDALLSCIEAKSAWRAKASPEELSQRIVWSQEESWQLAFQMVWEPYPEAFEEEKALWAQDLRKFFPIKVTLQEKKGKPVFKVDLNIP